MANIIREAIELADALEKHAFLESLSLRHWCIVGAAE